jgi:hypothetical protein
MGTCGFTPKLPDGSTDKLPQVYGDCQEAQCKAGELVMVALDGDMYNWGNECLVPDCKAGATKPPMPKTGEACPNDGKCSAAGACVQCLADADCQGFNKCAVAAGKCVPQTCLDGKKNVVETDIDCGGPDCAPCDVGKVCAGGTDCISGVCPEMAPLACKAATCADGVKNGDETDVDCGGACATDMKATCADGKACLYATDCASKKCEGGACKL